MVETVRVLVICRKRVLLLQKSTKSKNPNKLEFPGGKIDTDDLYEAAVRELFEETRISIQKSALKKIDFQKIYSFKYNGSLISRKVNYLYVVLDEYPNVEINLTVDSTGQSEDKHQCYYWIDLQKLGSLPNIADNSNINLNVLQNLL
jgi:8-oxo-dGTP pyrophosphatase MutT (NUDIX family)